VDQYATFKKRKGENEIANTIIMEILVTLLLQLTLRTDPCDIPKIRGTACEEYRIDKTIIQVCTASYRGVQYELVIDEDYLMEMWEDDRPSFEKGQARLLWKNIWKDAITGIGKPKYCSVKKLDQNRHNY